MGDIDTRLAACNWVSLPPQLIFQVTPLSGRQWGVVLQMSLPVILLDEALKYLSRNHMDGKWEAQPLPRPHQLPQPASASFPPLAAVDARCLVGELFFWCHEVEDIRALVAVTQGVAGR